MGDGRVEGVRLEKNKLVKDDSGTLRARGTGAYEEFPIQMIFRSIGYKGHRLPGVPFDERAGIIPNQDGRVIDQDTGAVVPRVYVTGWIKRGPSGVVGTNKPDAVDSVRHMLEDVPALADGSSQPSRGAAPVVVGQRRALRQLCRLETAGPD